MADKGIIFSAAMVRALLDGAKTQTRRLLKPAPPEWCANDRPGYSALTPKGHIEFRGWWPGSETEKGGYGSKFIKLPYAPGDRLYVREAHYFNHYEYADQRTPKERPADLTDEYLCYRATEDDCEIQNEARWRPSIHMPRWASRLWLEVTEVRVQRLHEISDEDARAEGTIYTEFGHDEPRGEASLDGGRTWHKMAGMKHPGWHFLPVSGPSECFRFPTNAFANLWGHLHTTEGERWEDNPWIVAVSFNVHRGNIDGVATNG